MDTLRPYVYRYLTSRYERGEIGRPTFRDLRSRLDGFVVSFGRRQLRMLGVVDVDRWLATIRDLRPSTRHAYLTAVKKFCRWMTKEKFIQSDPAAEIGRVRIPRTAPRALRGIDVELTIAILPDLRARVIVHLMNDMALRRAEVAGLRVENYDAHAATVHVVGKGDNQRVVPTTLAAHGAIDAYLLHTGATHGPLVRSTKQPSQGVTAGYVGRLAAGWLRDAGVKQRPHDGVSAHSWRHTAATRVMDTCHDPRIVQALLGHAHLSSVEIYTGVADLGRLRAAMEGTARVDREQKGTAENDDARRP